MIDDVLLEKNSVFGFFIAGSIISLAWSIGWRHYIRYWVGPGKSYFAAPKRRTVLGIRLFFLACFIGNILSVVYEIWSRPLSLLDIVTALLFAAVIVLVCFFIDVIFRWR